MHRGLGSGVGGTYLEVLLNQGSGRRRRRSLRICDDPQAGDVKNDDDHSRDGEGEAGEAALADANADEPESVDGGDDKRETIGSCERCNACQQRIVDLGDAEQVPRQPGDTGASKLDSHPRERNQQKSDLTPEALAKGRNQRSKQRVIETKIKTEENQDAGGDRLGEAAVEIHRLVDPVAVAEIPQEAA